MKILGINVIDEKYPSYEHVQRDTKAYKLDLAIDFWVSRLDFHSKELLPTGVYDCILSKIKEGEYWTRTYKVSEDLCTKEDWYNYVIEMFNKEISKKRGYSVE